ncbi:uncharacterized protein TNCV_5072811 [Trichonephila clavipes]|nr:uncharacterized protein TNCV_5072811 [Trichonephila clavipes]
MVELQKSPDSPDIFKLERCCYLNVKIDTFNRRPGPTQCYNCNLFNHSSQNCFIKTRCLKCGEPHKTGDCPITDKIENPTCINCGEKDIWLTRTAEKNRWRHSTSPARPILSPMQLQPPKGKKDSRKQPLPTMSPWDHGRNPRTQEVLC